MPLLNSQCPLSGLKASKQQKCVQLQKVEEMHKLCHQLNKDVTLIFVITFVVAFDALQSLSLFQPFTLVSIQLNLVLSVLITQLNFHIVLATNFNVDFHDTKVGYEATQSPSLKPNISICSSIELKLIFKNLNE